MRDRPALKFCLLLSAGIVAGRLPGVSPATLFPAAAALFLGTLVVLAARRWRERLAPGFVALTVVLLGALHVSTELGTIDPDDPERFISPDTVTVAGRVAGTPSRGAGSTRFVMQCDSLYREGVAVRLSGRVLVGLSGRASGGGVAAGLEPGRRVTVRGTIRRIDPPGNPGEIDWQAHYRLAGIKARLPVRSASDVALGERGGGGFIDRYVVPVREALSGRMAAHLGEREGKFLNGLVLGERNEVPTDLRSDFITVGVMHLLAISGQQVVLVAVLIAGILAMLRIPEKPRFVVVACALAYYVLLTGASASVTRAGMMSIVMLGARVAQRKPDLFNALGVAASGILLWDPLQLFDPGFLLSFSAVLAIVLLYPLVLRAAPAVTERCSRNRVSDAVWKGIAVSLAAGLGTAPIVAYFFGRVSLVGFLANILIVPLSSVALVLGLLTLGASFVWEWLASVYASGADFAAWLTFRLVGFFAGFPYASVGFRISLAALGGVYVLVALALLSAARNAWKPFLIGALFVANAAVYASLLAPGRGDLLRVTFLDVGQGDAAFIEFPGGRTMLVDAGPKTFSSDAGERTVVPFLRFSGVERLDYLVVSHPHGDHLGGVPAVMSAFGVGEIVEGGGEGRSSLYRRFVALSDSLGVRRVRVGSGDVLGGDLPARVYVLGPDNAFAGPSDDLNDRSVTLMVRYGGTSLLLPGDSEEDAESLMVSRYGGFLDADILKAGHHGSRTSTSPAWLERVTPAWTVVSAGATNSFGHPSPVILARLGEAGSAIHRTDLSGAGVFESDGKSWRRVDWRR